MVRTAPQEEAAVPTAVEEAAATALEGVATAPPMAATIVAAVITEMVVATAAVARQAPALLLPRSVTSGE